MLVIHDQDFFAAKANARLRDATEQLTEVLTHRLRREARSEAMEKRFAVVSKRREAHKQGGWVHIEVPGTSFHQPAGFTCLL